jgi:hypothetical protein
MPGRAVHVIQRGHRWVVARDGDETSVSVHDLRRDAVQAALRIAVSENVVMRELALRDERKDLAEVP